MKQKTIKVGIIGGAGYTAGELLRILLYHPNVEIVYIHSKSQSSKLVSSIHEDLVGECFQHFTDEVVLEGIDLLFLCMGHGRSKEFLESNPIPENLAVIDLSRDYRLGGTDFVYGLPELHREAIQKTKRVANPGCFATAIQLPLLPLAEAGWLKEEVHIHAITGSTGAGQSPQSTTHFSWRNNNLSVYKAFRHQHLDEIHQSLHHLQPHFKKALNFIPLRGDFARGIFASMYTDIPQSEEAVQNLYQNFFKKAPFVHISTQNPHLKQVVNTNKCIIHLEKHENKLLIISTIDNLLKGASGQAVQNMNLMFGLEETTGLKLKAMVF